MRPQEVERIGRRLFGPKWKKPLAGRVGVTLRTVYRWAAGETKISKPAEKLLRSL